MSLREDGSYEPGAGWVAGVDFDPSDPDEMEVMHAVWEQEKHDRIRQLKSEKERLRNELYGSSGFRD